MRRATIVRQAPPGGSRPVAYPPARPPGRSSTPTETSAWPTRAALAPVQPPPRRCCPAQSFRRATPPPARLHRGTRRERYFPKAHRMALHDEESHDRAPSAVRWIPAGRLRAPANYAALLILAPRREGEIKKPSPSSEGLGYKLGNNLLSRDLSSYYHWLLRA